MLILFLICGHNENIGSNQVNWVMHVDAIDLI